MAELLFMGNNCDKTGWFNPQFSFKSFTALYIL